MPEVVDFSWIEAHRDDHDLVVVDPRPIVKYLQGHIPNAVSLPSSRLFDKATLELLPVERLAGLVGEAGVDAEGKVLVYDDRDGQNMAILAWTLELLGHPRVQIPSRFMAAWIGDKRPIAYKAVKPEPRQMRISRVNDIRASVEEVARGDGLKLVDLRSREEFEGKTDQGVKTRHLPGAVNLVWTSLLGEGTQVFRSASELGRIVSEHGLDREDRIVTYCSYGPRAALGYLVLRQLGFKNVKVYDRSFQESSRQGTGISLDCVATA